MWRMDERHKTFEVPPGPRFVVENLRIWCSRKFSELEKKYTEFGVGEHFLKERNITEFGVEIILLSWEKT